MTTYLVPLVLIGGLTGLLWGGLIRLVMLHHVTWSINSVCHIFGTRRFVVEREENLMSDVLKLVVAHP